MPQQQPLMDRPAYRATEASRILAIPRSTVVAWSFGQNHQQRDGATRHFVKLIDAASPHERLLSFANLCELHVLSAMRRAHHLPMTTVRASLDYVARELRSRRPLIDSQFLTNGIDLFVRHADKLLNTNRAGQTALRGEFELALARIERGADDQPVRLFPFTRSMPSAQTPRAVMLDPRLAFGRPVLAGAGVTTAVVEDRFRAGDSPEEMAADFGVSVADILEAIRFEQRRAA